MNLQRILGATTPVKVEHGELDGKPFYFVLHAKLDALARDGKAAWDALDARESALLEKRQAIFNKLELPSGIERLNDEQQAALADYIDTIFDALATDGADVVGLLSENRPALDKFAAQLRYSEAVEKKQATALKKAMEKAEVDSAPIESGLMQVRAEKLCFLVARAEGQAGDQPPEPIDDWTPESVGTLAVDTFAELFDAVSKKVLARWVNRSATTN